MIFNEIKCHVNTSFGLLGGCIPCIAPWVRACLEPLLKIIALSEQLCLTAWRVIRLLWSNDIGCTDYHSDKKWRNLTTAFPLKWSIITRTFQCTVYAMDYDNWNNFTLFLQANLFTVSYIKQTVVYFVSDQMQLYQAHKSLKKTVWAKLKPAEFIFCKCAANCNWKMLLVKYHKWTEV